jgi:hypothetical protein
MPTIRDITMTAIIECYPEILQNEEQRERFYSITDMIPDTIFNIIFLNANENDIPLIKEFINFNPDECMTFINEIINIDNEVFNYIPSNLYGETNRNIVYKIICLYFMKMIVSAIYSHPHRYDNWDEKIQEYLISLGEEDIDVFQFICLFVNQMVDNFPNIAHNMIIQPNDEEDNNENDSIYDDSIYDDSEENMIDETIYESGNEFNQEHNN